MARARKTPEQFAAEMAYLNPAVELVDAYVDARTKLACRCRTCGCEWQATPNHLLRGAGCPACAGTQRLSAEDFAARVAHENPAIEVLEPYVNARTPLACRCRTCGHAWTTEARNLLAGCSCPACAHKRSAANLPRAAAPAPAGEGE